MFTKNFTGKFTKLNPLFVTILVLAIFLQACASQPAPEVDLPRSQGILPTSEPEQSKSEPTVDLSTTIDSVLNNFEKAPEADPGVAPLLGAPQAQTKLQPFLEFVSNDVNQLWIELFRKSNMAYSPPKFIVWDSDRPIDTGDGHTRNAEWGPFYLPSQQTIYIPLTRLVSRSTAVGDFALAIIVAHEYAHHLQQQSLIWDAYQDLRNSTDRKEVKNNLSVRMELQADCMAGVWAYSTYSREMIEAGDIEEAILILMEIGDDVISSGQMEIEEYTHGPAESRARWMLAGYLSGDGQMCSTWTGFDATAATMTIPEAPQVTAQTQPTENKSPEPQPQPKTTNQNALTAFWANASDPSCQSVEDTNGNTTLTLRCNIQGVAVDYDEWTGEQAWLEYMNQIRSSGTLPVDHTWESKDSGMRGPYLAYTASDGKNYLIAGVSARRFSVTASSSTLTVEQLVDWFMTTGVLHYPETTQTEPQPEPTNQNTLTAFWANASDPSCQAVNLDLSNITQTLRCNIQGVSVSYHEWTGEQAWLEYMNQVRNSGTIPMDSTWESATSGMRGPYLAYTASDGNTYLLAGVSAHRFSLTASSNTLSVDQLVDWFLNTGVLHYYGQ